MQPDHSDSGASDSGQVSEGMSGDAEWEHQRGPGGGHGASQHPHHHSSHHPHGPQQHQDGQDPSGPGGKKGGKKDLSHVTCRFYRVGACTAGAACPFSHTAREPGQAKQPCKWFQKGSCKFGHKCANAHILPGQPASMDWKNKKAAKVQAQAEAAAAASGNPVPPLDPAQTSPQSPNGKTAPPSGLSSMFGRVPSAQSGSPAASATSGLSPPGTRANFAAIDASDLAIGMSPMGLPLPEDPTLPSASSPSAGNGTHLSGSLSSTRDKDKNATTRPKPFSYASAVGAKVGSVGSDSKASPTLAHSTLPSTSHTKESALLQHNSPKNPPPLGVVGSPPLSAASGSTNGMHASRTVSATLSPTSASNLSRLAASVPAPTFFDGQGNSPGRSHAFEQAQASAAGLRQGAPTFSPTTASGQQPAAGSSGYHTSSRSPSYGAPTLQHSYSHGQSVPTTTRSLLNNTRPPAVTSTSSRAILSTSASMVAPTAHVFGTSPFGNNAIFLSTSHEDDGEMFMARAARSNGQGFGRSGETSPRRPELDTFRRPASSSRTSGMLYTGSSALADDDEDDSAVLEEELVPSSLKHLLTPDEKARRESRSGGKSGGFNPFEDLEEDIDDSDVILSRYSKSVPVSAIHPLHSRLSQAQTNFSKAPGSPPTVLPGYLANPSAAQGAASSNLAKHLLAGGNPAAHAGSPRIERGFFTNSSGPSAGQPSSSSSVTFNGQPSSPSASGNMKPAPPSALAGTSLPQGLAAGLSRLHLIPAGAEHTGYTPPASYIASPPANSGLHGGAPGQQHQHAPTSSSSLLHPHSGTRPSLLGSSYSIKLPTLGNTSSAPLGTSVGTGRRVSSNYIDSGVHVGSPLAKNEFTARHHQQQQQQQQAQMSYANIAGAKDKKEHPSAAAAVAPQGIGKDNAHASTPGHEAEDDELLFDMDV